MDTMRRPGEDTWISDRAAITAALIGLAGTAIGAATIERPLFTMICAVVVAMVYGVYFGFAIKSGTARDLVVETLFICVGLTTAVLALRYGVVWLAVGLTLHGIWDLLHHPGHVVIGTKGVPRWYVPFCAVYDFTAALAIVLIS